ncbi:glycosyltransferase family 4 protein [Paenibacillus sp. PAMC21692]|uniref:glycosyltransferase family 4 protein n=1 Tax=Paenibacillus sp. PAMC21692 TaxID=2762320 RepID=UPI00164E212F|nr:glycosyltransferase family 4 protein [Paenibacillus sp. PAMC21692]QNK58172.1 glycosyltransferase family 4 protein [Paenibacillus sp. PAMC21692]
MKILFITFESPGNFSGGGIVVRQSLLSLAKKFEIDYIGPEIQDKEIRMSVNPIVILTNESNKILKGLSLIKGITTGMYNSWSRQVNKINWDNYRFVYLEFTRYDFVANLAKENKKKLIVRVHNVETDYFFNIMKRKRTLVSWFKYRLIQKQEPKCISQADTIICLTEQDKNRLLELYPNCLKKGNVEIVPVCIDDPIHSFSTTRLDSLSDNKEKIILITGSMWYGPNVDGVIWFIHHVWPHIHLNFKLILAGSRPNEQLKKMVQSHNNIELITNPVDMKPLFNKADLYVAPIFTGAGMKVKIAEALAFGLSIIGTSHAFIGYNLEHGINGFRADSPEEFRQYILKYLEMDAREKKKLSLKSRRLFERSHALNKSEEQIIELLKE